MKFENHIIEELINDCPRNDSGIPENEIGSICLWKTGIEIDEKDNSVIIRGYQKRLYLIMTDYQLKRKIEKYWHWADYFSKLRYFIISKAIPNTITFTADGGIKYEYSQEIENVLEKINEIEESVFKEIM